VDVDAVGAALARLHALQPDRRLPRIDGHDAWSAAVEAAEAVAVLVPALGKRACRLAHRLGRALAALPPAARVVHGDFSPDQVVLTDNGVAIIDFDSAAVADPALDLGSFAADLDRAELEHRLPVGRAATAAAELVDGYHRAGGAPVDHGVAAHRAAALLRLAVLPFRERQPEWPVAIEAILAGAEAVAAESR
ncbi:MAG TPA: phosphotransferase, partial [Acidimicrobiales bacterium]|nr:phosphotransferase [Acidimicrobiales bacterium]